MKIVYEAEDTAGKMGVWKDKHRKECPAG